MVVLNTILGSLDMENRSIKAMIDATTIKRPPQNKAGAILRPTHPPYMASGSEILTAKMAKPDKTNIILMGPLFFSISINPSSVLVA